jgi:hypothetical protein
MDTSRDPKQGCCGEKELLKFESFTMTQHDAVVLLDMDTLVINGLDDAIDLLLDRTVPANAASHIMYPNRPLPDDIWLLHTGDYETVSPDWKVKPAQGGFAILKPNRTVYAEIMNIVKEGKWSRRYGWGDKDGYFTGRFWGVETFQGLVPYYFQFLNDRALELNWCQYNHMSVGPKRVYKDQLTNATTEVCFTKECVDCRDRKLEDLSSVHFTRCQKPWECRKHEVHPRPDDKLRLCHQFHQTWFEYRSEMERSWGRTGQGSSTDDEYVSQFRGYCSKFGRPGYEPIQLPYGRSIRVAAAS